MYIALKKKEIKKMSVKEGMRELKAILKSGAKAKVATSRDQELGHITVKCIENKQPASKTEVRK